MEPATIITLIVKALPLIKYAKSEADKAVQNEDFLFSTSSLSSVPMGVGGGLFTYVLKNTVELGRRGLLMVGINTFKQRSMKEAIEFTCMNGRFKSKEQALDALACVAMLYDKHDIKRPAEVGGTLILIFGTDVFPKISPKEGPLFGKEIPLWEIQNYRTKLVDEISELRDWLKD